MESFYQFSIYGLLLLGIAHAALTFRTYARHDGNAYWFFSAGLALVFAAALNYLNLRTQSQLSARLALATNGVLVLFALALSARFRKPTMYAVALVSVLLLAGSWVLTGK